VSEAYGSSSRSAVVERYGRNADAFEALIAGTPPDRWEDPSPCEGWVARDVVGHIVNHTGKALRARGVEPTPAPSVREDPLAAFQAIRADLERVFADPAMSTEVVNYLDAALSFDLPQHWWDLAKATGQDATMDPEFVQTAWDTLSPMKPDWWAWQRGNKHYGNEVTVPEDAPLQDRLLGLLGRNANWPWGPRTINASHWQGAVLQTYQSSLSLMERALRDCPDELWRASLWAVPPPQSGEPLRSPDGTVDPDPEVQERLRQGGSAVWNVAYHALWHLDYDISGGFGPWAPPEPFGEQDGGSVVTRVFTKDELLGYVSYCRARANDVVGTLDDAAAARPLPATHRFRGMPYTQLLTGIPGHVTEHASQIRQFLTTAGVKEVPDDRANAAALRAAIAGKSDAEIARWVKPWGGAAADPVRAGYANLLGMVYDSLARRVRAGSAQADVAFVHDDLRFVVRVGSDGATASRDGDAPNVLRSSAADLFRLVVGELSFEDALASGRALVEGDASAVRRLVAR
jgi:uncharacterized protein (TIGR03086 family)